MKILGIDPGYGITGFGLIDAQRGQYRLLGCGAITTPPASSSAAATCSGAAFRGFTCSAVFGISLSAARKASSVSSSMDARRQSTSGCG